MAQWGTMMPDGNIHPQLNSSQCTVPCGSTTLSGQVVWGRQMGIPVDVGGHLQSLAHSARVPAVPRKSNRAAAAAVTERDPRDHSSHLRFPFSRAGKGLKGWRLVEVTLTVIHGLWVAWTYIYCTCTGLDTPHDMNFSSLCIFNWSARSADIEWSHHVP